jgi:hypothetical protein
VCQDPCLEYHFGRGIRMGEEQEKGMVLVVEDEENSICLALLLFVCLFLCFCFSLLSLSHSLFRCPLLSLGCLSLISLLPTVPPFLNEHQVNNVTTDQLTVTNVQLSPRLFPGPGPYPITITT